MCLSVILCLILSIGSATVISPAITYPTGLGFRGDPLTVSKHNLFPRRSVETSQTGFQRKPNELQIKLLRSHDRFVISCSGSQYNKPDEIGRSESDPNVSLQKYVSESEDILMKEAIRVGSAVLISHILEMFVNAKGNGLANEDRQEVDALISLLRENLPGMHQFIVLVSYAVAAKYPGWETV